MKIFVKPSFQQIDGDDVLYEYDGLVALEVADASLYEAYIVSINEAYIETIESEIASKLTKELNALCDSKSKGVKVIIAGMEVSTEQMEEYQMVAYAVERDDITWFEDEALVLGTTAQAEFDKAKQSKIAYEYANNTFKKLIRVYRRWNAKNINNGDFSLARKKIEEAREIGVGLVGSPMEVLTQSKEQVMQIIQGDSNV